MNVKFYKNKGFSLIELLVVMFVIAILTSVLLPNLLGARQKAKDAQRISDLNAIKGALRLYYNENQNYPTSYNAVLSVIPTYMSGIAGVGFTYSVSSNNDRFSLTIGLESNAGDEDINSQIKCGTPTPIDGRYTICAN